MPANLENSLVATGLEKVYFHSSLKDGQRQRMCKLRHNCSHFTCQQAHAQNLPSQALTVPDLRTFRCINWIKKKAEEPGIKLPTSVGLQTKQENSRKTSTSASLTTLKHLTVDFNKLENSSRDGNARPLCLPPEETVCRARSNSQNWTWNNGLVPNWERSVSRLYIVTCLLNLYAEHIMRNTRLDEAQAGIKGVRRNISNLRYANDATIMVEREEELEPLDESERGE